MDYQLRAVNWHSDQDMEEIIRLTSEHIVESLADGLAGDGYAVGTYLMTAMAVVDDQIAAVYSYDPAPEQGEPPAVELIYVRPQYRRRGLASALLDDLRDRAPSLTMKSPLTPACEALAGALGIPATTPGSAYLKTQQANARYIRQAVPAYCAQRGHRRREAFQACSRCTHDVPYVIARAQVEDTFAQMRRVDPLRNVMHVARAYEHGTPQQRALIEEQVRAVAAGVRTLTDKGAELPGKPV